MNEGDRAAWLEVVEADYRAKLKIIQDGLIGNPFNYVIEWGKFYVYVIHLPVNDYLPAYVGVTNDPRGRWSDHRRNSDQLISKAVRACEGALFNVIAKGSHDPMYALEAKKIVELGTRWPCGYNIGPGGEDFNKS